MSIISDFYRYYADAPTQTDFADVVLDAVEFIYERITEYWSRKKPTGGVDLSDMPGQEFGFKPMEVQVFRQMRAKKGRPPVVWATTLLSDIRQSVTVDKDYTLRMSTKVEAMRRVASAAWQNEAIYRTFTTVNRPAAPVYAIAPAGIVSAGRHIIPILYNLELGEVYYIVLPLDIGTEGKLFVRGIHGCIMAMNWITGQTYHIGCKVESAGTDIPGYRRGEWLIPAAAQLIEKTEREMHARKIFNKTVSDVRESKGAEGDDFALTDEDIEHVESETRRQLAEKDFHITLGPVTVMTDKDRKEKEEEEAKRLSAWYKTREGPAPNHTVLPCNPSWSGNVLCTTFLEQLYALPESSLNQSVVEFVGGVERHAPNGAIMSCFWNVRAFAGNLFQSVLQTTQKNSWFLTCLLFSIREGGWPLSKVAPDCKTINKWLGITKPDYEKLLNQPTEALMVLFLMMNQIKPTSYKQVEECYKKLLELNDVWLKEYDREPPRDTRALKNALATLKKGKGNRILFETFCLPQTLALYTKHNLKKKYSPMQYVRYIIDEGKHSGGATLAELEKLLLDYNRMAKEIVPKIGFSLPHNLRGAHDTMVSNYTRIMGEKKWVGESAEEAIFADEVMKFASCYTGKVADVCPDEKFTVVAPVYSLDLYEEGIILNHCVGSYGNDIMKARGSMLIFFLRLRKNPDRPLVTMQVDRSGSVYELTEIAGKGNRLPTPEEQAYAERWLGAFNKAVIAAEKARTKEDATSPAFKKNVTAWLSMLGAPLVSAPLYNVAMTKEDNYCALFAWAAEILMDHKERGAETVQTKKDFTHSMATLCASLRFTKATFDRFVKMFDFLWEKSAKTAA